jgi:cytochrome b subunit of formate dehydrogenase
VQLQTNIQYAAGIAEAFAIIAGVALVLFGIAGLKRYAEMRGAMGQQQSMAKPLMLLICGSLLLALPTMIPIFVTSVFVNAQDSTYQGPSMMGGLFLFIRFIGLCTLIKGIIMLAKTGGHNIQPGARGKALIHMFCGVLLMHIVTVQQIAESFYT